MTRSFFQADFYGCAVVKGDSTCPFKTRKRAEAEAHWAKCKREDAA